jgi:hypothetical protein
MWFERLISFFKSLITNHFRREKPKDIIVEDFETTYLFEHNITDL